MSSKIKLKKLILNGFRGAIETIPLDMEDSKSLVVFGNNGDGKSCFSDAIEWFFKDSIDYLRREGCGRDDYFNRYMTPTDDATVECNFNNNSFDAVKTLKRRGGYSFSNTTYDFSDCIMRSVKDSFILRHHTMRDFVEKTKTQKLDTIEEIIGFGIVRDTRDTLLKSLNALKDDRQLSSLHGQLGEKKRDLVNIVQKDDFSETDVLNSANQLVRQCDPNLAITNDADFKSICKTLEQKIKASSREQELLELKVISKDTSRLPEIREFLHKISAVTTPHNDLANQQETLQASAIDKLYKAAIEAIQNELVELGRCPVCKQPVDTDTLKQSLIDEVEQIKEVLKARNAVVQEARTLIDSGLLTQYHAILSKLLEDKIKNMLLTDAMTNRLTGISTLLAEYEGILHQIQQAPKAVTIPQFSDDLKTLEKDVEEIQKKIVQREESLSETDEEKLFYQNVHKLGELRDDYTRYKEIDRLINIYNNQIESLKKIYQDFERMERESIQKVLKAISSDVNDFITFLHPDDNFDEVELIPTEARGVEFKMKYHGEEVSPPMKILSEAHLNSLGICVFLASAKHFNKTIGFLVLDDVVTSFDMGHRRPLARLINEKFPDIQFLLYTHDELWFDMLKKDLTPGKWLFKELMKWTKNNGLALKDSPLTLKEKIQDCLNSNDTQGATTKCRILIEEILKEKCDNLGVRGLEYRRGAENDKRNPSELIDALISYLKDNETLRDKQSKQTFKHLRADQLIANIGSHHQTFESTALSRGDIETALRDIAEFESLFVCTICGKEPSKKYSPINSKLKQCECGDLKI